MEIRKSSPKSLHLPEEIIEEILSRLPAKSLLRFRCVSKSWRSLIGSQRFIKTHHQNSMKNPSFPHQRLIIRNDIFDSHVQCSLLSVLSEPTDTIPASPLPDPTNTTLMHFLNLGSCNGLLCTLEVDHRIQLWNPSTRISKILPEDFIHVRDFGFGWVESGGEYKVFVLVAVNYYYYMHELKWVGKVYSSRTKSWKTIEHCANLVSGGVPGIFAGGKLYWKNYGDKEIDIIFLDLKSEVFGRIEPPFVHDMYGTVGVLGGVLCYIVPSGEVARVWVMKEEGWKRVATFANLVELLQPAPLVVGPKGEILVNCESMLLVYNRQDNVFRCPEVNSCYNPRVYVESLVSLEDL